MNYLIGDIGNTNIKICKINKNFKIVNTYIFQTKNLDLETINRDGFKFNILKQEWNKSLDCSVNYILVVKKN